MDEIERLRETLQPIFKQSQIRKVYLFGSLAKGAGTRKSDVDLMIVADTEKRFFERYEDFGIIQEVLRDRAVDMLIYTPEELSRISHRTFIKNILEQGVVLYER